MPRLVDLVGGSDGVARSHREVDEPLVLVDDAIGVGRRPRVVAGKSTAERESGGLGTDLKLVKSLPKGIMLSVDRSLLSKPVVCSV